MSPLKRSYLYIAAGLVLISQVAFADLPTKGNQMNRNPYGAQYQYNQANQGQTYAGGQYQYPYTYNQGQGAGANYYNPYQYQNQQQAARYNTVQNVGSSAGDLLWLFTGSDASIKDQVKGGFQSNSDTSFGGRLFGLFLGAVYKRFGIPLENKLGALENSFIGKISGTANANYQYPYNQQGANYCYQCTQQNATNPYARNQQAIGQQVFQRPGTTGAMPASTNSVGGIR